VSPEDASVSHASSDVNKPDKNKDFEALINLPVDKILTKRYKDGAYLVKLRDKSYRELIWLSRQDIESRSKQGKTRLNKFDREWTGNTPEEGDEPWRPYMRVEKIIGALEVFPVIHPRRTNEMKGKWSEHLARVCSRLLNYTAKGIVLGVYVSQPLELVLASLPHTTKVPYPDPLPANAPVDIGTLNNRLYLGYYKRSQEFWNDLGSFFKFVCGPIPAEDFSLKGKEFAKKETSILKSTTRSGDVSLQKKLHEDFEKAVGKDFLEHAQTALSKPKTPQSRQLTPNRTDPQTASSSSQSNIKKVESIEAEEMKTEPLAAPDTKTNLIEEEQAQPDNSNFQPKEEQTQETFQVPQPVKNPPCDLHMIFRTLRAVAYSLYTSYYSISSDLYRSHTTMTTSLHSMAQQIINDFLQELDDISRAIFDALDKGESAIMVEQAKKWAEKVEKAGRVIGDFQPSEGSGQNGASTSAGGLGGGNNGKNIAREMYSLINVAQSAGTSMIPVRERDRIKRGVEVLKGYVKKVVESAEKELVKKLAEEGSGGKAVGPIIPPNEIEQFNPGEFDLAWLGDQRINPFKHELLVPEDELKEETLIKPVDRIYLVKWSGLSYLDATWEKESELDAPDQLNEFRQFNRSFEKESRQAYLNQVARHRELTEYMNSKKTPKITQAKLNEIRSKLYHLDAKQNEQLYQYTAKTQPIFKDKKLLRTYQLESVNWLISSWFDNRNVILADEMGLGKTIQTVAFLNFLYSFMNMKGPFLIIAPLSTLEHWKRSVENWSTMNGVLYYDPEGQPGRDKCRETEFYSIDISMKGIAALNRQLPKFHILITSFEVFMKDLDLVFRDIAFQHIVVDEAHRLKNQNARLMQALKSLPCQRLMLLTGTPIQNNIQELWTLLNLIAPAEFHSSVAFNEKFGKLESADAVTKLHSVLKPYLLRRLKQDVEQGIPPLRETIIDVEMTPLQKRAYKAIYDKNKDMLIKGIGGGVKVENIWNNMEMQLRKCCNHPWLLGREDEDDFTQHGSLQELIQSSGKMVLLDKLMAKTLEGKQKMLIFSQFTKMLNLIEEYLIGKNILYERIDGSTKSSDRQNSIDRFSMPNSKVMVFMLSTKAGGVGINLTSANVVVIFDSDWNPQNDVQATARAHRIGQSSEVNVYRFITKKTYEAGMFDKASKKLGLDQAIFLGGNFTNNKDAEEGKDQKKLSKQEMEILLKKGIMGLIEEGNEGQEKQATQDINEILAAGRVAHYSLVGGGYTVAKSSFVVEESDKNLEMDDPDFWKKTFQNSVSECERLYNEYVEKNTNGLFKDKTVQHSFMEELLKAVNKLTDSKVKIEGYSVDDEKKLTEILTRLTTNPTFEVSYKSLGDQMISEISKPSRRGKLLSLASLQPNNQGLLNSRKPKVLSHSPSDDFSDGSDSESPGRTEMQVKLKKKADKDREKEKDYLSTKMNSIVEDLKNMKKKKDLKGLGRPNTPKGTNDDAITVGDSVTNVSANTEEVQDIIKQIKQKKKKSNKKQLELGDANVISTLSDEQKALPQDATTTPDKDSKKKIKGIKVVKMSITSPNNTGSLEKKKSSKKVRDESDSKTPTAKTPTPDKPIDFNSPTKYENVDTPFDPATSQLTPVLSSKKQKKKDKYKLELNQDNSTVGQPSTTVETQNPSTSQDPARESYSPYTSASTLPAKNLKKKSKKLSSSIITLQNPETLAQSDQNGGVLFLKKGSSSPKNQPTSALMAPQSSPSKIVPE
jgi:SNF2 family DNA or RNA helicase